MLHSSDGAVLRTVRALLLTILCLGMIGTAADLLLLDHYEDAWQMAPLGLIGVALAMVLWVVTRGGWLGVLGLRTTMVLFVVSGAAGIFFHYNGNQEFQREIDPELAGWALFVKVMTAKAPPALAPAVMVQLGLLGLLYTYRHPALHQPVD